MPSLLLLLLAAAATTAAGVVVPEPGCYRNLGGGTCSQWWGWSSTATGEQTFAAGGAQNYLAPGAADQGQPSVFAANLTKLEAFATNLTCGSAQHWFLDATNSTSASASAECVDACAEVSVSPFYGTDADGVVLRLNTTARRPEHLVIDVPACIDPAVFRFFDCAHALHEGDAGCPTTGLTRPIRLAMSSACFDRHPEGPAVVLLANHGAASLDAAATGRLSAHMPGDCSVCDAPTEFACPSGARRAVPRSCAAGGPCTASLADEPFPTQADGDDFFDTGAVTECCASIVSFAEPGGGAAAMRFPAAAAELTMANATVSSAFIRFDAGATDAAWSQLVIEIEDSLAPADASGLVPLGNRTMRAPHVVWEPPAFTKGTSYTTPDLAALVNGLLAANPGVCPTAFLFRFRFWGNGTGEGTRQFFAHDKPPASSGMPELVVSTACPTAVVPRFGCVEDFGNNVCNFEWGYRNDALYDTTIPVGQENYFSPSPADRGQPVLFPGNTAEVGALIYTGACDASDAWTIDSTKTAAVNDTLICPDLCGNGCLEVTEVISIPGEDCIKYVFRQDQASCFVQFFWIEIPAGVTAQDIRVMDCADSFEIDAAPPCSMMMGAVFSGVKFLRVHLSQSSNCTIGGHINGTVGINNTLASHSGGGGSIGLKGGKHGQASGIPETCSECNVTHGFTTPVAATTGSLTTGVSTSLATTGSLTTTGVSTGGTSTTTGVSTSLATTGGLTTTGDASTTATTGSLTTGVSTGGTSTTTGSLTTGVSTTTGSLTTTGGTSTTTTTTTGSLSTTGASLTTTGGLTTGVSTTTGSLTTTGGTSTGSLSTTGDASLATTGSLTTTTGISTGISPTTTSTTGDASTGSLTTSTTTGSLTTGVSTGDSLTTGSLTTTTGDGPTTGSLTTSTTTTGSLTTGGTTGGGLTTGSLTTTTGSLTTGGTGTGGTTTGGGGNTGACCDVDLFECTDGQLAENCNVTGLHFFAGGLCADGVCAGVFNTAGATTTTGAGQTGTTTTGGGSSTTTTGVGSVTTGDGSSTGVSVGTTTTTALTTTGGGLSSTGSGSSTGVSAGTTTTGGGLSTTGVGSATTALITTGGGSSTGASTGTATTGSSSSTGASSTTTTTSSATGPLATTGIGATGGGELTTGGNETATEEEEEEGTSERTVILLVVFAALLGCCCILLALVTLMRPRGDYIEIYPTGNDEDMRRFEYRANLRVGELLRSANERFRKQGTGLMREGGTLLDARVTLGEAGVQSGETLELVVSEAAGQVRYAQGSLWRRR